MKDIIFKTDDYVFSYRVSGILIQNDKVLLQKPIDDEGFAFPGGHVALGETNEETLIREFKEEINADIEVKELKWVGENFFPMGDKPCHQIALYYKVELIDNVNLSLESKFMSKEYFMDKHLKIEFHWVPIEEIDKINIYPINAGQLLKKNKEGVAHFIYRQQMI